MDLAAVIADLKASLHDSANVFNAPADADFLRLLRRSLPDMQAKRPVTRLGSLQLVAGEARYPLGDVGFAALKMHQWGDPARTPKPWEPCFPGVVPRVSAAWDGAAWWMVFESAPTALQIHVWGSVFSYWYFAEHVLDTTTVSIAEADVGLLLLRAQVEAMRELMLRNMTKVVQMRDGYSGTPRNATPAAMYELLHRQFMEAK